MAELVDSANEPLIWHEAQVNLAVRRTAWSAPSVHQCNLETQYET